MVKKREVRTIKRKFKNIAGKVINVLTKCMVPDEVLEFEVPAGNVGRQNEELWITSKRNEISNLLEQNYIEEVS